MHIDLVSAFAPAAFVALYFLKKGRPYLRQDTGLPLETFVPESGRRYKEIFDNGSDGVFVVEVLARAGFRFESLNPSAIQAISPQGVDLVGCSFDKAVQHARGAGFARFIEELEQQLGRCIATGLPVEYESASPDGQGRLCLKLVPMADDTGIGHVLCFAQDITARKLYEQELLARGALEERLSGFAASAPGFFFSFRHGADGSNAMPFASAGIKELFGIRPGEVEISIAPLSQRIHPSDLGLFFDSVARSAVDLLPFGVEFRVRHPQRGELWIEARATPIAQADGAVVWHGFMHDIGERKLAERRLQEAREFTDGIVNAISDIVLVKDRQHRWLMLNDAACSMFGLPREELVGKTESDLLPKENADLCWAGDERVFTSGLVDVSDEAVTMSDGETRYMQAIKSLYSKNGEQYLIAVIRDITERKKMEEVLLRSRENLAEAQRIGRMGSWELDFSSGELIWSDEFYRILELDPAMPGASHQAVLDAIHPDDRERVRRAYAESLENRASYSIDYRLRLADGRIKYVRGCGESRYGEDGRPLHSHGTMQDITVLKGVEFRLMETQARLRELVISRETLVETERKRIAWEMHEELGQLLAAMRLRVHSMRSQLPKELPGVYEDCRAIDVLIARSIKTVLGIVSDLRPTVLMHGPVAALEWLVSRVEEQHRDIVCRLVVDDGDAPVSDELTILVFRIAQEAIENLIRHEGVASVLVSWTGNKRDYFLRVRHDGEHHGGSPAGIPRLNLFGMQERVSAYGGEMKIFETQEEGTVIEARFPADVAEENQYSLFGGGALAESLR